MVVVRHRRSRVGHTSSGRLASRAHTALRRPQRHAEAITLGQWPLTYPVDNYRSSAGALQAIDNIGYVSNHHYVK